MPYSRVERTSVDTAYRRPAETRPPALPGPVGPRQVDSKAHARAGRKHGPGAFWAFALLLTVLASGCERGKKQPTVTFDSKPGGAVVWLGNDILGPAPQDIAIPAEGGIRVRLALPGYRDWERRFDPQELTAGKTYRVELPPRELLSVWFRSTPSDADVRVNGELRGRTPLLLGDLSPGHLSVAISAAGRESVQKNLELKANEETPTVSVNLPGLTEEIYRRRIAENPEKMGNYADLAHYLVLQKRFEEAAVAVANGLRIFEREKMERSDARRLLQELQRIPSQQYEYGSDEDVKKACKALAEQLEKVVSEYPKADAKIYRYYIMSLLRSDQREKAAETAKQALVVHPDHSHIKRYARSLGRRP